MKIQFGLECEFFITKNGEICAVPTKYAGDADGSGLCLEARSKPYESITEAVYSLKAEIRRITKRVQADGYNILMEPVATVSKAIKRASRRDYVKDILRYENLYGHEDHKHKQTESPCGIHISVTVKETKSILHKTTELYLFGKSAQKHSYKDIESDVIWDYPQFIRALDIAFKEEIKSSKRNPGFYELKSDGRFEYRSLPNNIDLEKLIDTVSEIKIK